MLWQSGQLTNPQIGEKFGLTYSAYGSERNIGHGGTMNPLHEPKECIMETLHLKLSAPYFYPTLYIRKLPDVWITIMPEAQSLRKHFRRANWTATY
jgi:hypothetical protein